MDVELYTWTLTFELHVMFTCHETFFFNHFKKRYKPLLGRGQWAGCSLWANVQGHGLGMDFRASGNLVQSVCCAPGNLSLQQMLEGGDLIAKNHGLESFPCTKPGSVQGTTLRNPHRGKSPEKILRT